MAIQEKCNATLYVEERLNQVANEHWIIRSS